MKKLLLSLSFAFVAVLSSLSFAQNGVWTYNTTDPSICDGAAFIDSSLVSTNEVWAGNGNVIQMGGSSISNLCAGTYTVTFTDTNGNNVTVTFTIGSGSGSPCSGFTAYVSTTDATNTLLCDGTADVLAYGGTAPYSYVWDNGVSTTTQSGLCPGNYTCFVTDANGCSVSSSGDVYDATTGTIDSILIFTNNSFPNGTVIDTLNMVTIEDCTIDYSLVVSASITNAVQVSVDTVMITWSLFDMNGNVLATYSVPYFNTNPATGVYSATLIVFCGQKSINYNTIQITDQFYVNPSAASIVENNVSDFTVINPFNETISMNFTTAQNRTILLSDMSGKVIFEGQFNETSANINTAALLSGMYFLTVKEGANTVTKKLIK
jgi:hypothetical protein